MRRFDWMILAVGLCATVIWTFVSAKDGFKGSNAMIVARSISITSTMEGQVDNDPPPVGARVSPDDLLVRIKNGRIDRGRQADFDSEIGFLRREIENAKTHQEQLAELLQHFRSKGDAHAEWMLKDVRLKKIEDAKRLEIANNYKQLSANKAERIASLFGKNHSSDAELEIANTEAAIARSQAGLSRAQLDRNTLLHESLISNGMFFENGDASYWDRMIDSLTLRQIDNLNKLATLDAQLIRITSQSNVEHTRIGSSVDEEHYAPSSGVVNATYVANGTRVTSGMSLLQVLDCANPVVIVPIPEHRIGNFAAGMKVTVYPIDTDDEIAGSIDYISSGPLIGHDQTLLLQEDMTLSGVHAVVSFEDQSAYNDPNRRCESARRAVVVIHNKEKGVLRASL